MPKVISAFEDHDSARRAVDALVQAGFQRSDVHVARGGESDLFTASSRPMETWGRHHERHEGQGVLASIGHALATVFGMDSPDEEAKAYLEAVRRGHSVVVVEWADQAQAQRARQVMKDMGAIDINERARLWHAGGWRPGRMPPPPAATEDDYVHEMERQRNVERALAADQAGSERAWGVEGPAGARGDKPGTSR